MQGRTIATRLREDAEVLIRASDDHEVPVTRRRAARRCAPFLIELSQQPGFCDALGRLRLSAHDPVRQVLAKAVRLVDQYRLPTGGPFSRTQWAALLAEIRIGHTQEPILPRDDAPFSFKLLTVHFIHELTVREFREGKRTAPAIAISLTPPGGGSQPATRQWLTQQLMAPLREFRAAARSSDLTEFSVRLVGPAGPAESTIVPDGRTLHIATESSGPEPVAEFHVANRKGARRRRIDGVAHEIARRLLPHLRHDGIVVAGQGRLPNTERAARWWAQVVFGGRSVAEIADSEVAEGEDAAEMHETIERALRRMGVPPE